MFCHDEVDTMWMGGIALDRKVMLLRCTSGLFEDTNEGILGAFAPGADLVNALLGVVMANRGSSEKPYPFPSGSCQCENLVTKPLSKRGVSRPGHCWGAQSGTVVEVVQVTIGPPQTSSDQEF